jgi:hypothetical protein
MKPSDLHAMLNGIRVDGDDLGTEKLALPQV